MLIIGNTKARRPHPLVRTGSLPLPLHQQNWATTRLRHLMPPWPVGPTQALEQMASSPKKSGNAATSTASVTTVASPSTCLPPDCHNSQHPKPPVAGCTTFTIMGEPEATIKEEVEGPLTESEN